MDELIQNCNKLVDVILAMEDPQIRREEMTTPPPHQVIAENSTDMSEKAKISLRRIIRSLIAIKLGTLQCESSTRQPE